MIFTLTIKQIYANKRRLVSTAFAIILGVAFLAGTLVLTDTIKASLNGALATANAGTDAYIRGQSTLDFNYGQSGPPVDANLLEAVSHVPGVRQASPEISGYAQIVDRTGKAIGKANTGVLGMNWVTIPELNPYRINAGRAPTRSGEIAIDKHSADTAHLHVGDQTTVLSKSAPRRATIVGIVRFGTLDTPGALSVVLFDRFTAQAVLNDPGQLDAIAVTAEAGVSPQQLTARLAPIVGPENEAVTGAQLTKEHQKKIDKSINQFGTFLTMFALIALFVGAFIIYNTFSIVVSQRTKEMALLRAVGASGKQVRTAVLAEAGLVGLVASGLGVVGGIGVAAGLQALLGSVGLKIPMGTPVVTRTTVVVCLLIGVAITFASALMPARRASKVLPIEALRDIAQDRSAVSRRRIGIGLATTAVATTTLLAGLTADSATVVGLGGLALFFAVSILGPVLARPFAAKLGRPIAKLRGTAGAIARQNAMRNPHRTARTSASLTIGVALVAFLTIFAASVKSAGADEFRHDFKGTSIIDSGAIDATSGLSPTLAATLKTQARIDSLAATIKQFASAVFGADRSSAPKDSTTRNGLRAFSEERAADVQIDGKPDILRAYDTRTIAKLFNLGHVSGNLRDLGPDGIAVHAETGTHAVRLGETRTITFPTGTARFTVRATYDHSNKTLGDQFVDLDAFNAHMPVSIDSRIFVDTDNPAAIDRAAAPYPTATVLSVNGFIAQQNANLDTILALMYALLVLAVVIALLGIANTLALSIHERTRELGLLRAIGMNRAQVRSSVRWEAAIIAVFGTGTGLALGTFLGWIMVRVVATKGFDQTVIPIGPLLIVSTIATAAGVGAALLPAWRAARVDVLRALAA